MPEVVVLQLPGQTKTWNLFVRHLLTEDRCTTLQMIADRLNIGKETVHRIVTEDLGKRKICARFVPHALTTEQHHAAIVKKFLANRNVVVLHHPPYSPDLAPADYFLLPQVKIFLKRVAFSNSGRNSVCSDKGA